LSFPHRFRHAPATFKGIRERSAVVRSAELALPALAPVSRAAAQAALERSRARRNGATA